MGIIKKNKENIENQTDQINESLIQNQQIPPKTKILGNIIKQDFLGKELLSFNFPQEKTNKKIIKKEDVKLPINEVIDEFNEINIVSKSTLEFELQEEKNKYQKLNQELQEKINEQESKIKEIESQKQTIIDQAQKQAELIIKKAIEESQNKAKEIFQQAYQEGIQQGSQKIKEELEQIYNQKISQLIQEINNFINIRQKIIEQFEEEIIELVFTVAEKIINKKINEEPNIVTSYLADLLSKVERSKSITIWVNPDELEDVRNYRDKIKNILEDVETLNIAPDERIEKGGCIIETNFGKIDSRISSKLDVLKEIILKGKNA